MKEELGRREVNVSKIDARDSKQRRERKKTKTKKEKEIDFDEWPSTNLEETENI